MPDSPDQKIANMADQWLGRPPRHQAPAPDSQAKLARYAQAYALDALDTLIEIMDNSEKDRDRISAAEAILDRAVGRPAQDIKLGGGEKPMQLEVVRRIVDPPVRDDDPRDG